MGTTRLSLIREGEIVLLLNYGEEMAVHVMEHDTTNNKLTKVMVISDGDIVYFGGDKSTYPITDGWVVKEIENTKREIEEKTVLLQKLIKLEKND